MRRKKAPPLTEDLARRVAPETAGNPCSDEKWVRSRRRGLSQAWDRRACPTTIGRLLRDRHNGLRSHRKVPHTGKPHAIGRSATWPNNARNSVARATRK